MAVSPFCRPQAAQAHIARTATGQCGQALYFYISPAACNCDLRLSVALCSDA